MNPASVRRNAYLALALALALALVEAGRGSGVLFGLAVPFAASAVVAVVGAAVGAFAVTRRSTRLAMAGAGVIVLAVVPAGELSPGFAGYALALLFAGAALLFTELVHQAARHERAHRLVDEEHVEEESVERVTDEALRTLAARAGLALLLTAGGALVALLLSAAGPQYFRDGLESASTLGAAVWTLLATPLYLGLRRRSRLRALVA